MRSANDPVRVLLDIDGVAADFCAAALPIIGELTGQHHCAEDLTSWDHVSRLATPECWERFRAEGFCAALQPLPGAVDGVRRLRDVAEVLVVTSPIHGKHWYERVEWCFRHLGILAKNVCFTGHKEHVVGNILIDDRVQHVERWAAAHPYGIGLVWSQPYNEREELRTHGGTIRRARSWDDAFAAVEQIKSWGWR